MNTRRSSMMIFLSKMVGFFLLVCTLLTAPQRVLSIVADRSVCPSECRCLMPASPSARVECTFTDEEGWRTMCQELNDYSQHHPKFSLKLESVNTASILEYLHCLPSLNTLDLSNLGQLVLDSSMFSNLEAEHIVLRNNNISSLPSHILVGLRSLQSLDLSHNLIETLETNTFSNLTSLKTLDLSFNKLQTLPKESLSQLHSLEVLLLEYNQLSVLSADCLPHGSSLRVLNLTANQLSSIISSSENDTLQGVREFDLSLNPIECSCRLGDLFLQFPRLRQSIVNSVQTVCASPPDLAGRQVLSVSDADFPCQGPSNIVSYPALHHSMYVYHNIILECKATGYPAPSVMWIAPWGDKFYKGSFLPEEIDPEDISDSRKYWDKNVLLDSTLELTDSQSLKITNFRGSFAGNYTCIAVNVAGNETHTITLKARSKMKAVYLESIFIGGYCASGFFIFGLLVGAVRNLVIRLRHSFNFKVPIFSKSPSEHPQEEQVDDTVSEGDRCNNSHKDSENPDGSAPPSPSCLVLTSDEEDGQQSPSKPGNHSPSRSWRTPAILGSIEEARGRLRFGVGRKMDHLKKNVQSIKESGTVYVHTIYESGSTAASKVKAGMVLGVETVKSQVQSFKELCGTGNMGTGTISMMSVETDVDTNERKDIIRQVTFV